jgi:hypothetical protein
VSTMYSNRGTPHSPRFQYAAVHAKGCTLLIGTFYFQVNGQAGSYENGRAHLTRRQACKVKSSFQLGDGLDRTSPLASVRG